MPKHGERKNHREETTYGKDVEYCDQRTGEVVFKGPMCSTTQTVWDRWCAKCQKWVQAKGVFGGIWCPECNTCWNDEVEETSHAQG